LQLFEFVIVARRYYSLRFVFANRHSTISVQYSSPLWRCLYFVFAVHYFVFSLIHIKVRQFTVQELIVPPTFHLRNNFFVLLLADRALRSLTNISRRRVHDSYEDAYGKFFSFFLHSPESHKENLLSWFITHNWVIMVKK